MPQRAAHGCGKSGCKELVRGAPRCPAHTVARPSAAARGYDAAWSRLRAQHLAAQPRCQRKEQDGGACRFCQGNGGGHVDHIRAHRGIEMLRLDPRNLQTLCASAHSSKTARYDGGLGNEPTQ